MTKTNSPKTKLWILSIFVTGLLFHTCTSKNDNHCSKFKSGNFVYNFRGPQGQFPFTISRNDSIQTEINSRTGDISKFTVRWTSECSYELRLLESTANYPDSIMDMRKNMVLKNEIVSWTNDYYLFKSKPDNSDFILSDTLWINQ
jgi:hypothetical protein